MKKAPLMLVIGLCLAAAMSALGVPEIEDPRITEINKLPPRGNHWPQPEKSGPMGYGKGPWVRSLDGDWKFSWCARPEERPLKFHEAGFDATSWANIPVPSTWEREGHGTPLYVNITYPFKVDPPRVMGEPDPDYTTFGERNPVGSYLREFEVPGEWDGMRVVLHFGGVRSAMFVWVNGQKIGYSQGSRLPAEFDITEALVPGGNRLAVEVYRFSDGSYLEDQDFWRLSGIYRDVFIAALPAPGLWDAYAQPEIDLGTEFGVLASDVLEEEIHVKEGRVMVEPKHSSLDPVTLGSGEAVRANAIGKLRRIPFSSDGFLTDLPLVVPYQHWSFDEAPDDELPSSGMGVEAASMDVFSLSEKAEIPVELAEGRFGRALQLSQKASCAKSGFAGIEGGVARTVAFWVKALPQPAESDTNLTAVAWGLPTEFGTKWRLGISRSGRGMGTVWGGAWANSNLSSDASILDGEWHHLVYAFTGSYTPEGNPEILHYLDGKKLEVRFTGTGTPVNTECVARHSRPLTLGAQIISKPSADTFEGSIDELYIFRGVLEAEQIQSLYEMNSVMGR